MPFVFEKLRGLARDAVVAAVEPVLRAHGVSGVELIWRTDNRGWVLYLTVERPDSRRPGEGVTLDDCSELSRDLSAALDVADVIQLPYRLEVGTPGLERTLYVLDDYRRFSGQNAKLKLTEPWEGEWSLRGTLQGLDDVGRVLIDTERGLVALEPGKIDKANLVLDFGGAESKRPGAKRGPGKSKKNPPKRPKAEPGGT
ncbi:MAG TPA: ribosome maturation factor RimP [Polyangiaceae bacterium]|jgi:ribosome maturation factor RimP|nr:ribosome maturation factor RimP [Polyangiaceae bacterium]